jgi:hypothetical protein
MGYELLGMVNEGKSFFRFAVNRENPMDGGAFGKPRKGRSFASLRLPLEALSGRISHQFLTVG